MRVLRPQIDELHPAGSVVSGVGSLVPVDEEGHQPVTRPQVRICELPGEHLPVALLTPAVSHLEAVDRLFEAWPPPDEVIDWRQGRKFVRAWHSAAWRRSKANPRVGVSA